MVCFSFYIWYHFDSILKFLFLLLLLLISLLFLLLHFIITISWYLSLKQIIINLDLIFIKILILHSSLLIIFWLMDWLLVIWLTMMIIIMIFILIFVLLLLLVVLSVVIYIIIFVLLIFVLLIIIVTVVHFFGDYMCILFYIWILFYTFYKLVLYCCIGVNQYLESY